MITRQDVETFNQPYFRDGLDSYQYRATKSAIYPGRGTPLGLIYVTIKINGEAGELAEQVGKAMRDDGLMEHNTLTDKRREAIIKEAGDVLWYLSAIATELDMTLSEIALTNLQKLADRTERDTLRGSGDNR